jgi:hypothetical protein
VRDKKPIAVDRVRSGGVDVEIFYDFREHYFFFEMPGTRDRESAETFVEVRRRLGEVYERADPLAWVPVILVTLHKAYDEEDHSVRSKPVEGASVSLRFRRCELSPRPDRAEVVEWIASERERDDRHGRHRTRGPIEREGYLEREHAIDFEARNLSDYDREVRAKTIDRPSTYDNDEEDVELPYDEDTWRGLCALKVAIDELHGKVKTLIGLADFRDRLKRFARDTPTPLLQEVTVLQEERAARPSTSAVDAANDEES